MGVLIILVAYGDGSPDPAYHINQKVGEKVSWAYSERLRILLEEVYIIILK